MFQESFTTGEVTSLTFLDSPTAAQATASSILTLSSLNLHPWLHQLSSICSHNLQH